MSNTGYKQATIAYFVSKPSNEPLDVDGNFTRLSGKKQAIRLLEGFTNPNPNAYEVTAYFKAGDTLDGNPTRVYDTNACPVEATGYITATPATITLDEAVPTHIITVDSSHNWEVANAVPSDVTLSILNGTAGVTSVTVTRSDTATDNDFSIVFLNTTTNDTASVRVLVSSDVPNRYPDVSRENIIGDVDEDVARIGEQYFTRRNVQYRGTITDNFIGKMDASRLYNWRTYFSWADIPAATPTGLDDPALIQAVQEHNGFFGTTYFSLVFIGSTDPNDLGGIINQWNATQGGDPYKHQIPTWEDVRYLLAFTLCHIWDGVVPVNDALVDQTKGLLGVKGALGDDPDDDKRFTYPSSWSRACLINGQDKYGLALSGSGTIHRGDASAVGGNLETQFISGRYLVQPVSSGAPYAINTWQYRKSQNNASVADMTYGTMLRDESSAAHGSTIRSVRYKKLNWDVYQNGTEIRKIRNGEAVPAGFTVIPRGALRGAYFANPTYTYDQLKQIGDYVEAITNQWTFSIG